MNGSELLLPFVVAQQRREADYAVLIREARRAAEGDSGKGGRQVLAEMAGRLRRELAMAAIRGQLGPTTGTARAA